MKQQGVLKKLTVAGLLIVMAAPVFAVPQGQANPQANPQSQGQLSEKDYRFFTKAARGGMEEVELGQLAQQKGSSAAVRDFGQRMVTDHGQANQQLQQIAAQKGLTMPMRLSHHEDSTMNKLQKESGVKFDQAYAKSMVKDHQKDVKEFESASKDLTDPDLKAWAQKTLPVLQEHLRQAQQMETAVKSEK